MRISVKNLTQKYESQFIKPMAPSSMESLAIGSFKNRPQVDAREKGLFGWSCRHCGSQNGEAMNCCQWCYAPRGS